MPRINRKSITLTMDKSLLDIVESIAKKDFRSTASQFTLLVMEALSQHGYSKEMTKLGLTIRGRKG